MNVSSNNNAGKIQLNVAGDVELNATNNTVIKQNNSLIIQTSNPINEDNYSSFEQTKNENNFKDKQHNIDTGLFNINDGNENFILGQTFKQLFDNFIDTVSKTTVSTVMGQMPILNAEQVAEFKNETKNILSQVGFIDK